VLRENQGHKSLVHQICFILRALLVIVYLDIKDSRPWSHFPFYIKSFERLVVLLTIYQERSALGLRSSISGYF
jgi:hypothetical protein